MPPARAALRRVETAEEMSQEVKKSFPRADVLVMAAAVSDFKLSSTSPQKIKKREASRSVGLVPTEDILAVVRRQRGRNRKIVVGFAAETENVKANARKKLRDKSLDLIVANDVSQEGIGFDSDLNQVTLIDKRGRVFESEKLEKRDIARFVLGKIEVMFGKKG
jgi:phosphopantothenoylcysteine decarboxylase/phosphopantothenate--cysteine ligase